MSDSPWWRCTCNATIAAFLISILKRLLCAKHAQCFTFKKQCNYKCYSGCMISLKAKINIFLIFSSLGKFFSYCTVFCISLDHCETHEDASEESIMLLRRGPSNQIVKFYTIILSIYYTFKKDCCIIYLEGPENVHISDCNVKIQGDLSISHFSGHNFEVA